MCKSFWLPKGLASHPRGLAGKFFLRPKGLADKSIRPLNDLRASPLGGLKDLARALIKDFMANPFCALKP